MAKEVVTGRVDESLIALADRLAAETDQTRSQVVERALELGLTQIADTVRLFEGPMFRETMGRLLASPAMLKAMARIVGQALTDEQISSASQVAKRLIVVKRKQTGKRKAAGA